MWERFRRFSALERQVQKVFLRALVLLPMITWSLKWRGFRATQASLTLALSNARLEFGTAAVNTNASATARMVEAADRHGLVHPSCLVKSLTLWWLLARQGIPSQLRIGVRKEVERFEAHAWVDCDGTPLNEPDEHHQHYVAFDAAFSSLPLEEQRADLRETKSK
jgi:hypothetical protein